LLDAIAVDDAVSARSSLLLARLRAHQEKNRAALREWHDLLDRLYEHAVSRDFSPRFLIQWVSALLEKERAHFPNILAAFTK
jgi:hypothetical protein